MSDSLECTVHALNSLPPDRLRHWISTYEYQSDFLEDSSQIIAVNRVTREANRESNYDKDAIVRKWEYTLLLYRAICRDGHTSEGLPRFCLNDRCDLGPRRILETCMHARIEWWIDKDLSQYSFSKSQTNKRNNSELWDKTINLPKVDLIETVHEPAKFSQWRSSLNIMLVGICMYVEDN